MPEITHMFPKRTLDSADFGAALGPGWHTLRIVGITDKTFENSKTGEQELTYFVQFAQFRKPVRLNQTNAFAVVDATGESNSDNWIGKLVQVQAYEKEITENSGGRPRKKRIWVIDFREKAPDTPEVQLHNADVTGQAIAVNKGLAASGAYLRLPAGSPMPAPSPTSPSMQLPGARLTIDHAIALYNCLFKKGKDEAWLRDYIARAAPQLAGIVAKPIKEWTYETSTWIKVATGSLPNINSDMSEQSVTALRKRLEQPDVVDTKTGEVITPAATGSDDIPF